MTESEQKGSITFISRSAPYGSSAANQCLDMSLAAAVFEQSTNYIFLEDGVFQLLKNQDGKVILTKTMGNALEALDLYGIDKLFVDEDSLKRRNLSVSDLIPNVETLSTSAISDLIDQSKTVFNL